MRYLLCAVLLLCSCAVRPPRVQPYQWRETYVLEHLEFTTEAHLSERLEAQRREHLRYGSGSCAIVAAQHYGDRWEIVCMK